MEERVSAGVLSASGQARALYRNGRLADAIAAAESTGLSDPQIRLVHAGALYDTGDAVGALDLLARLCTDLLDRPDVERFTPEFTLFSLRSNYQTPAEAAATLQPLRQTATAIGDAASLAGLHLAVARLEALRGSASDARMHLGIARLLAANAPTELRCSIELVSTSPLLDIGSVDKARATAVWAFDVANANEQLVPRARALGNMGLITLYLGNAKQARAYLDEARITARELSFVQAALVDSLALAALFEGDIHACRDFLDEVQRIIQAHRVPARSWYDLTSEITRCLYFSTIENWQGILDVVDAASPELERRQLRVWHASLLSAKARALAHLGQHDAAEHTLLLALQRCPRGAVDPLITVEAATGTCLTLRGDAERGARHFGRALRACQAISHRFHEWAVAKERDAVLALRRERVSGTRSGRNDTDDAGLILSDVSTLLSSGQSIDVMAQRLSAVIAATSMRTRLRITDGPPAATPVAWDADDDGTHRITLTDADRSLVLTVHEVHLLEEISFLRTLAELAKTAVAHSGDRRQQDEELLWPQVPLPTGGDAVFWSPRMQELLRLALKLATSDLPILITGETGTGKEVIAKLIHANSKWSRGPFVAFNASTVPKDLAESQLFGHRKGAFTGAVESAPGLIRAADHGTLFLDEIGDLDFAVQPKLLRFLESGEIHPLGDSRPIHTRVRVVAATNTHLESLVSQGRFRPDLFYRLRVATIALPPLRDRKDEIPALAAVFVRKACKETGRVNVSAGADFVAALLLHDWPGNIRQLSNEVRRAVTLAEDGATLTAQDLSPEIAEGWVARRPEILPAPPPPAVSVRLDQSLDTALEDVERAFIRRALEQAHGRISEAAQLLGISRKGLFLKRKKLGLD